jgi:hypothetical protein
MILAFGGQNWVSSCISRWAGQNTAGIQKLQGNNAERVCGRAFEYEHVICASCDDYRASADEEVEEQEADQKEGRKMDINVLVLYSERFARSRGDIGVWREWMGEGGLELKGFGEGAGHFIAEERSQGVAEAIMGFYEGHI